jgi:acetyl esterase
MTGELDPEPRALLDHMLSMPFSEAGQPVPREYLARLARPSEETGPKVRVDYVAQVRDLSITAPDGAAFAARLYTPMGAGPFPIHIFFHGGGWIVGSAFESATDRQCQRRCAETSSIVLNVEYRLAPEHRFPTGVEDCYTSVHWAAANAAEINGDATRISVGGRSAGGNLAAAVSLMTRDRGGPRIILQLLEIAEVDCTKSTYLWRYGSPNYDVTREVDLLGVNMYLNSPDERVHPYVSPALAPNLSNVAPVYALSAEFDPRRDGVEMYGARINDAGGEAVTRTMIGHIHGSDGLTDTWHPARLWAAEANAALRHANVALRHANASTAGRLFDNFNPTTHDQRSFQ